MYASRATTQATPRRDHLLAGAEISRPALRLTATRISLHRHDISSTSLHWCLQTIIMNNRASLCALLLGIQPHSHLGHVNKTCQLLCFGSVPPFLASLKPYRLTVNRSRGAVPRAIGSYVALGLYHYRPHLYMTERSPDYPLDTLELQ